jgi:aspartate/methionine/tyrosine aminotransferase
MFGDEDDRYVRFSLLQPLERIAEAAERMAGVIVSLQAAAR